MRTQMQSYLLRGVCAVAATVVASLATAQQPPQPLRGDTTIRLFESAPPASAHAASVAAPVASVPASKLPSGAEYRRARALYQSQMNIARIEAAQWMGYHLSRPNWPANPMMTSRYAPRRTVIVPVYIMPVR